VPGSLTTLPGHFQTKKTKKQTGNIKINKTNSYFQEIFLLNLLKLNQGFPFRNGFMIPEMFFFPVSLTVA